MKKLLATVCFLLLVHSTGEAIDLNGLESIGPVSSLTRSANSVTFNCADNSQVRVYILAPDLVRVRASFKKAMPDRDHSWAIDRTSWENVRWSLKEESDQAIITTDVLDVLVHRSPLLVEFREANTHRVINQD